MLLHYSNSLNSSQRASGERFWLLVSRSRPCKAPGLTYRYGESGISAGMLIITLNIPSLRDEFDNLVGVDVIHG